MRFASGLRANRWKDRGTQGSYSVVSESCISRLLSFRLCGGGHEGVEHSDIQQQTLFLGDGPHFLPLCLMPVISAAPISVWLTTPIGGVRWV